MQGEASERRGGQMWIDKKKMQTVFKWKPLSDLVQFGVVCYLQKSDCPLQIVHALFLFYQLCMRHLHFPLAVVLVFVFFIQIMCVAEQ